MAKLSKARPRITIRLNDSQMLLLEELSSKLNAPLSLLVRTMVGSFITQNEAILQDIVDGKRDFDKNWNKEYEERE